MLSSMIPVRGRVETTALHWYKRRWNNLMTAILRSEVIAEIFLPKTQPAPEVDSKPLNLSHGRCLGIPRTQRFALRSVDFIVTISLFRLCLRSSVWKCAQD